MITIPDKKLQMFQNNRSDVLGNIWSTFNIDLQSNLGRIRLSPRMQVLTKTGDTNATNLGCAIGFKNTFSKYWTIAGTSIYNNSGLATNAFTLDTSTSASTDYNPDYSDIELYSGLLYASAPTKLRSNPAAAWTDRATFASSTVTHLLNYFVKFNRLYAVDDYNVIGSIDGAYTYVVSGNYSITTSNQYSISAMKSSSTRMWIGTIATDPKGLGRIFDWDGISSQITTEYKIDARGIVAIYVDNEVVYAVDTRARLLKYTGYSFDEIARFPINSELNNNDSYVNNRFIHPNGILKTKNGTLLFLLNNLKKDGTTIGERCPSGVWEYSKDTGLVHKTSLTYTGYGTSTITDYGQTRLSRAGGLLITEDTSASGQSGLLLGATYFTDASTATSGIFIEEIANSLVKSGYFVSMWFSASALRDMWQKSWVKFRQFLSATDKLILKYRTRETTSTDISITWQSTTSFNTTTDVSGMLGYEVEVTQGKGAGKCAHITGVTFSSPNYTVTVDETFTGASGTALARIQNWTKIGFYNQQTDESEQFPVGVPSERIQVKLCVQFTGDDEIHELAIINEPYQSLT